jgi:hypothetical protein
MLFLDDDRLHNSIRIIKANINVFFLLSIRCEHRSPLLNHQELNHYVIHHQAKTFLQSEVDLPRRLFPKEYFSSNCSIACTPTSLFIKK